MRIKRLELKNFRGFEAATVVFPVSNVCVFIGTNGAGKSAILDALGNLLNHWIIKLKYHDHGSMGFFFTNDDIKLMCQSFDLNIDILIGNKTIHWDVNFNRASVLIQESNDLDAYVGDILNILVEKKNLNLPVFVYFKSEMDNTKPENYFKDVFQQITAYDDFTRTRIYDFKTFVDWFDAEVSYENNIRLEKDGQYRSPKLQTIRTAIERFLQKISNAGFKNLKIKKERIHDFSSIQTSLTLSKGTDELKISQLSSGEKSIILLVIDIALRLAMANPSLENKLEGEGIILIDEIDLHLHPQWQREVVPALSTVFPNIQFVLTTHSAQVLSNVHGENIRLLDKNQVYTLSSSPFGRDSNAILEEIMGISRRPKAAQDRVDAYFRAINARQFDEAERLRVELRDFTNENDPVFLQANALLNRFKMLQK